MDELAQAAYEAWRSAKWEKALNPAAMTVWDPDPDWLHLDFAVKAAWLAAVAVVLVKYDSRRLLTLPS